MRRPVRYAISPALGRTIGQRACPVIALSVALCLTVPAFAQTACLVAVAAAMSGTAGTAGTAAAVEAPTAKAGSPGNVKRPAVTAPYCNSNANSNSSYPLQLRPVAPGTK